MKYIKYFEAVSSDIFLVCLAHREGSYYSKKFKTLKGALTYIKGSKIKFHQEYVDNIEILYKFILKFGINEKIPGIGHSWLHPTESNGIPVGEVDCQLTEEAYKENLVVWDSTHPEYCCREKYPEHSNDPVNIDFFTKYINGGITGYLKFINSKGLFVNFENKVLYSIKVDPDLLGNAYNDPTILNIIKNLDYNILYNEIIELPDAFKILNKLKKYPIIYNKLKEISPDKIDVGQEMGGLGF